MSLQSRIWCLARSATSRWWYYNASRQYPSQVAPSSDKPHKRAVLAPPRRALAPAHTTKTEIWKSRINVQWNIAKTWNSASSLPTYFLNIQEREVRAPILGFYYVFEHNSKNFKSSFYVLFCQTLAGLLAVKKNVNIYYLARNLL